MKIVVYSMAHRGDVFPFVPIASELVRRGHDVTFVVPREFHPVLAAEPFRCVHSGTDFSPVELDEHGAFLRRWGMKMGGAVTLRLYFGKFTVPISRRCSRRSTPNWPMLICSCRTRQRRWLGRWRVSAAGFHGSSVISSRCWSRRPRAHLLECRISAAP
jgi:hypothetical protein